MSHVAKVELVVQNLDWLKAAWAELGGQVVNQSAWRWYGRWVNDYSATDAAYQHGIAPEKYGHADAGMILRHPDASYDIGVYKNPKGEGYVLVYDNFCSGRGLEVVAGVGLTKLKTEYGVKAVQAQALTLRQKTGQPWRAVRQVGANGHQQVALVR